MRFFFIGRHEKLVILGTKKRRAEIRGQECLSYVPEE
jgi:hypothetical protein